MKTLIAIAGCHARRDQADAQRQTWVRDVQGADVRFFAGGQGQHKLADEVWLDCPDGYTSRKDKMIGIFKWALANGYDYLWKVDDDVYLRPERLLTLAPADYQGVAVAFLKGPVRACMGCLYGLSRRSMELLLAPPTPTALTWFADNSLHEDIWVGLRLREVGVLPTHMGATDQRPSMLCVTHWKGVPTFWPNQVPPCPNNSIIASIEYTPEQLREIHLAFRAGSSNC